MKIVYKSPDDSVSVLIPTEEALSFATMEQIADKDVPHNLPYWILKDSEIPTDRTLRNAWRVNPAWGDPSGFGGESNEFDSELMEAYHAN